jgi:hypothetical protein
MSVDPEQVRASHRERLRAAKALRRGARQGRLSDLTFANRLEVVLDARRRSDLAPAVADLPPHGPLARAGSAVRRWLGRAVGPRPAMPLGLRLPPAPGAYLIGRDNDCDLRLTDDTVSRRHAMLTHVDDEWMITDMASSNGTRLNGWRLRTPSPIRPGDVLDLGLQRLHIVA